MQLGTRLKSRRRIVDLPLPVAPTRATVVPPGTLNDTCFRTGEPSEYCRGKPGREGQVGGEGKAAGCDAWQRTATRQPGSKELQSQGLLQTIEPSKGARLEAQVLERDGVVGGHQRRGAGLVLQGGVLPQQGEPAARRRRRRRAVGGRASSITYAGAVWASKRGAWAARGRALGFKLHPPHMFSMSIIAC